MSEGDVVQHAFTKLITDIRRTNPERAPFVIKFIKHVYENWDDLIAEAKRTPNLEKSYLVDDEGETFDIILFFKQKKGKQYGKVKYIYEYNSAEEFYIIDKINALYGHPELRYVYIKYSHKENKFNVQVLTHEEHEQQQQQQQQQQQPMQIDTAFVDLNYRRRHSSRYAIVNASVPV